MMKDLPEIDPLAPHYQGRKEMSVHEFVSFAHERLDGFVGFITQDYASGMKTFDYWADLFRLYVQDPR